MTRIIIATPLALAACAIPCPQDRVICDPATKTCICERPTGSLAAAMRGEGTDRRDPPAVDRPEPPRDHVTEPEPHDDDPEPDSATHPDEHRGWQERNHKGKWR